MKVLATYSIKGGVGKTTTAIPNASVIEQMGIQRAPIADFAPNSPATIAYRQLWADIAARIWS